MMSVDNHSGVDLLDILKTKQKTTCGFYSDFFSPFASYLYTYSRG